jgi:hypothetical protein
MNMPRLVPLICAAASLSCSDAGTVAEPAELATAQRTISPLAPRSGAIVDTSVALGGGFGGGPPTNLALAVGDERPIAETCAAPDAGPFSPQRGIAVETPSGRTPLHSVSREALVQVFEYAAGLVMNPCDLAGAPLVAAGRGFMTITHSQLTGPGSGPGSFVLHETVVGILDLATGGKARVHGTLQVVVRPDGSRVIDRELVTLTPL